MNDGVVLSFPLTDRAMKRVQLYSQMEEKKKKKDWLSNTCWIMVELLILQLADWSLLHFLTFNLMLFNVFKAVAVISLHTLDFANVNMNVYCTHFFLDSQMFHLQFIWREHLMTHKSGTNLNNSLYCSPVGLWVIWKVKYELWYRTFPRDSL